MAYEDTRVGEELRRAGRDAANRVQREIPETVREQVARMNPQAIDASDSPPIGMRYISTMTT